jgi:2-iminoacetate synthase ThiH
VGLREPAPDVHIQAFTASEIAHLAEIAGKGVPTVLAELKEAGLGGEWQSTPAR